MLRGPVTALLVAVHLAIILRLLLGDKPLDPENSPPWRGLALFLGLIVTFLALWCWDPVWIGLPAALLCVGAGFHAIVRRHIIINGKPRVGWGAFGQGIVFLVFGSGLLLFYVSLLWDLGALLRF